VRWSTVACGVGLGEGLGVGFGCENDCEGVKVRQLIAYCW